MFSTSPSFQWFQVAAFTAHVVTPIIGKIQRVLSVVIIYKRKEALLVLKVWKSYVVRDSELTIVVVFRVVSPTETGTEPKISKFDVPIAIDQYIIGLNITMNESYLMYTFYSTS